MEAAEHIPKNLQAAVAKLEDAIGKANVKTSKMERLIYSHDLAPLPNMAQLGFKNVPDIVVRPSSTEDLQNIVKIAAEEGIPITPRGSSTWGLAGSVPVFAGLLIDFTGAMNKILKIDEVNLEVTAQAGCTWKQVYEACLEKGMLLGSYPSSYPSATIGGWTSTGGIGVGTYKYGGAADNIRDMEVVMPDGTIVNTGFKGLCDNMTGYNLTRIISGAEGTLGVISNITFKLTPAPEIFRPLTYFFKDLPSIGAPLFEIAHKRVVPLHISFSDGNHFELLKKAGKHVTEVATAMNVVLEGDKETVAHEEAVIDAVVAKFGGRKADDATAAHEWAENCYEFRCREVGLGCIPGEVVVPVKDYAVFANRLYELMDNMKMTGAIIGIMADRNTVMFMPYFLFNPDDLVQLTALSFSKKCGDMAMEYGGRPLGFGAFFASNLDAIRGNGAKYIRAIKKTIDPQDIMNPGKLTGTTLRYGIKIPPILFDKGMDAMALAKIMLPRDTQFDDKAAAYANERMIKERAEKEHQHPKH